MDRLAGETHCKIVVHLQPCDLFGFCLDCYTETEKSLDRSKLGPSQTQFAQQPIIARKAFDPPCKATIFDATDLPHS